MKTGRNYFERMRASDFGLKWSYLSDKTLLYSFERTNKGRGEDDILNFSSRPKTIHVKSNFISKPVLTVSVPGSQPRGSAKFLLPLSKFVLLLFREKATDF